ncbi:hypothetical protein [Pseudomonas aegrilactucae]|uniref:Uncharacterized protein n=1 Tax=Pseudomonas aegrilactucae TaxID=2854028 RepID=A0A9Q3AE34_9PSED|nr:hypothetical protein [Pseudomonas aegrilactucae]MBV6287015.1 hypothetical protein [Pseudomonas aegrilactucae]
MKRTWMLLPGLLLAATAQAGTLRWPDIRDGSLYLAPAHAENVRLSWVPAWQADANQEQVYLLDPSGRLAAQRIIAPQEGRGKLSWPLEAGRGSYQVAIPGYSFRRYRLEHDDTSAAQFAPAKVHFSLETERPTTLYFRVAPGERAVLAGKFHDGVRSFDLQRLSDNKRLKLALLEHAAYWQFDQVQLPLSPTEQVWRLNLNGSGKAAFWLDGSANLFALRAQDLTPLQQHQGTVNLRSTAKVMGPTPRLGNNLPYVLPPVSSYETIDALKLQAAGYYTFADVLARKPQYELPFRRLYQERFGILHDITLMAATGRKSDLMRSKANDGALDDWLATSVALGGKGLHYIAFADEPNLNYADYSVYRSFFAAMAQRVRAYPGAHAAGVRIAMPASSRLLNGPLRSDAAQRIGLDWARRLLAEFEPLIDALAWHEWMIRDLLATRSYRDSVRRAAELVGLDSTGRPRKALLLDQTNLSSGSTLSLYEQNTQYAALWWASVVINASQDGLLDMLNWFHIADEPEWPKGMVKVLSDSRFELKPVGLAQQFIGQHWLDQVLQLDNDAFEVDALAMARGEQRSLLGVNKGERLQRIRFTGSPTACTPDTVTLTLFGPDNQPRLAAFDCRQGMLSFELPGQTLFALRWSAS